MSEMSEIMIKRTEIMYGVTEMTEKWLEWLKMTEILSGLTKIMTRNDLNDWKKLIFQMWCPKCLKCL